MKHWVILATLVLLAGCDAEQPPDTSPSLDEILHAVIELADDPTIADLPVFDISVPFERYPVAPLKLAQIADHHNEHKYGVYLLRYFDDTLVNAHHVFVLTDNGSTYFKFATQIGHTPTRQIFGFTSATYDPSTTTLHLQRGAQILQLGPHDITPAGA